MSSRGAAGAERTYTPGVHGSIAICRSRWQSCLEFQFTRAAVAKFGSIASGLSQLMLSPIVAFATVEL